jgi:hypothetical protein
MIMIDDHDCVAIDDPSTPREAQRAEKEGESFNYVGKGRNGLSGVSGEQLRLTSTEATC